MLPLRAHTRSAWLYVSTDTSWPVRDLERISEPLGRLIDVAVERERIAEREAETEAGRRAEVARTAILHAISHDLRSPLTAITTAGSALRAADITEGERDELIEVIEEEGARLAKLVDDLLDLSKIQAGAVSPQADWCDLHDVVASAAGHLRTDHPIEFALPHDLPLVRADASQLERVFSNLIENAVKFSPPHAPVRITAGIGSARVTVRVIDRGRGVPTQHRTHVFEPFFRVRGNVGSGSGLGLAIARGFVEANGGNIVLQSDADRGTSFAVSFPVVPQPEAVAMSEPRVLVVDDEPQIVRGLKIVLRSAGYAVEAAGTKEEALAAVALRPPDAVVLDLVLPDGRGVEVCEEVRRWSRLPILVLSAVGDEREKVRALDAGADDYVTKPFGTDELLARLRAIMRRSAEAGGSPTLELGELVIDLHRQADHARRRRDPSHPDRVRARSRARTASRAARNSSAAAAGGVGTGVRGGDPLSARARRPYPLQARARSLATSVPHHRARRWLPPARSFPLGRPFRGPS